MKENQKIEKAKIIVELLEKEYPDAKCSLEYKTPFQLLIATRLSAQCTDHRVNLITPALFEKFPDAISFKNANLETVETLIKSCGLYKTKAADLIGIGTMIVDVFNGEVPNNIEDLTKLPGVGRKTANLICGDIYKKPAIVTDTHFIRLCNRLGFVKTKDPFKVEMSMKKYLEAEKSSDFCHRAVLHGRVVCTARKANCEKCCLNSVCEKKI